MVPLAKRGKPRELGVEGPLISNFQDVLVEGALQGLGILYAYSDDLVLEALEAGRLKRVLADGHRPFPGSLARLAQPTAGFLRQ